MFSRTFLSPAARHLGRLRGYATEIEEKYASSLAVTHWAMGAGFMGAIATVTLAQNAPKVRDRREHSSAQKNLRRDNRTWI